MAEHKMNQVVEHLINTTYRELKKRNGRTPTLDGVMNVAHLIVTNNYETCLKNYLDTQE